MEDWNCYLFALFDLFVFFAGIPIAVAIVDPSVGVVRAFFFIAVIPFILLGNLDIDID